MPSTLPTPVAAAIGLLPAVLDQVRRAPARAVTLPVIALGSALTAIDTARREYDDLAQRGERLVAQLRGTSLDELEDRFEQQLATTPLAGGYDAVADRVDDVVDTAVDTGFDIVDTVVDIVDTASEVPVAEQPKGEPTPKATEPDATRVDTAASAAVVATVEQVAAETAPSGELSRDDLPLADYDHLTLGSLRGRLRSLTVEQLVVVRDYEKKHAARLPVVTMLDNRIAKLATDATATATPGAAT